MACLWGGGALAQAYPISSNVQTYAPLVGATPVTLTSGGSWDSADEGSATIQLGFNFPYYGTNISAVGVDSNGVILLGATAIAECARSSGNSFVCYSGGKIPDATRDPHSFIAPWWDDLDGDVTGVIRYLKPNASEIVIEYSNWRTYSTTGAFSFQVRLNASGLIQIHYGTNTQAATAGSVSVGFENETGTLGTALLPCSSAGSSCKAADWPTNTLYTIGQPEAPDLVVSTVALSNMSTDGGLSFTLTPTFRNFGQDAGNNFLWKAYLSTDKNLSYDGGSGAGADALVFSSVTPISCAGLSSVNDSAGVSMMPAPPPGQYYVLVEADVSNVVAEASETNNVGSTTSYFTQGIDLVSTSVSGPANSGPGNTIQVNVKYFNQGTTAAGLMEYKVHLSVDNALNAGDFVLYTGTKDITGGQTVDENLTIAVPGNVPGGDFFYLLEIDSAKSIAEANETNNVVASTAKVNIKQADLVIDSVDFLDVITDAPTRIGYFGQQGRLKVGFHNAGGADATNFKVGIAISTDANPSLLVDTIAHDEPVASLAAGASTTIVFNFDIPLKDRLFRNFTTGNYYLFAILDSYDQVTELSKGNNNLFVAGAVNLRAPAQDYAVSRVDAPASAAVGEVAPIFRVIKNVGNVAGSQVSYRFYASANPIITPDDIPLGIVDANGSTYEAGSLTLGIGGEDTNTEFVKLPAAMPPGTYYLGCIVDPAALVAELEEGNNALASGSTVQVASPAMRISTSQLPDAVVDRPYYFRLVGTGVQGASSWSLDTANGALPAGLSLGTDGSITGTPTSAVVSAFTALLQSGTRQAAARLVLRVLPPTSELEVTTRALPPVINSTGLQYQATLGAAGGVKPYTWRVASGTLPLGITLGADGVFAGTVRSGVALGEVPLTLEVQDSVGSRASSVLKMRVVVPGALVIKNLTVPDSLVNYDYLTDLAAQNSDGSPLSLPLSWSLAGGTLPDGLNLSTQAGERGIISGKPLVAGTYTFSLQVEDGKGRTDMADFILRVFPVRFRVSASTLPGTLHPGDSVDFAITSAGSVPANTRFAIYAGALPPGLSLSGSGQVSGTVAAEDSTGIFNFVVEAKDTSGGSGLGAFTLEVTSMPRQVGCSSASGSGWALALLALPLFFLRRRRHGAALALMATLALPQLARAQTTDYQKDGPNPGGYITLTGGTLSSITSYSGQAVPIPFSFQFFGQSYSTVTVTQHGYLLFAGDDGTSSNMGIPHSNTSSYYPQTFIAPWWDYLTKPTGAVIRAQTLGTAPTRRTIVEWSDVVYSGSSVKFRFQVQLFEGTHQIRFAYGPTAPATATASMGLQKAVNVGIPAKSCTTATSGTCSPSDFPVDQSIDFLLPPDLTVSGISGDPTAYAGVAFRSSGTLKNGGGRTALGSKVRFFLSTTPAFNPASPGLGESAPLDLASETQQLVSASGVVPVGTAPGNYFLIAKADPDEAIAESNENNNLSLAVQLKVGPPTPDLLVSGISGPTSATGGATLAIARNITNIGNASAGAFNYTYFISDNPVVSYSDRAALPASSVSTGLAAGASNNQTDQVTLPGDLAPGKYWVGVCVDYDPSATPVSAVTEINEVNNCATAGTGFILDTGALAVVTTSLPGAAQYSPYGLRLQASGGDGQYAWTMPSGSLPPGMTLGPAGDLTGTPAAPGNFSLEVTVTSGGAQASANLTLAVTGSNLPLAIVDQELPVAEFSRVYSADLVAVGGKPPYRWSLKVESRLPVGLALSSDGHLEGRASDAGEFPFTVELVDSASTKLSKDLRIRVVTPATLHIATSRLATGYLKKDYLQPLVAVGGRAPYAWSVVSYRQLAENPTEEPSKPETSLPASLGIKLEKDPSGQDLLRGAPTRAGLFALTFRVQDGAGAEDITTLPLSVSYEDVLAITTTALPDAFVGHGYLAKLSHNGGTTAQDVQFLIPCVKQVAPNLEDYGCASSDPAQTLPPGLLVAADGQISGTPTALPAAKDGKVSPVVYSFLVKVTDAQGRQDVRGLSIKVRPDFAEGGGGCQGVPLAPSLGALLASALLALSGRRRVKVTLAGAAVLLLAVAGASCSSGPRNLCVDKNIRCETGLICDPDDGVCKCGGRGGSVCLEGFVCDSLANTCLPTRCVGISCGGGTSCDVFDAKCKCGGTGGVECGQGQVCHPATKECVPVQECSQVACPRNQICEPGTGLCRCGDGVCAPGKFCSISAVEDKVCLDSLCAGVTCVGTTACDPADGYCKCNGVLCMSGEACSCPAGVDGGACEAAARSCRPSSACTGVTCAGGTTCDPADGQCKCGGPGGPVCSAVQICALGPPPQCQGGQQCLNADGGTKVCGGGTSCDPEDGKCKCGGRGGAECKAATTLDPAEVCVSNPLQKACFRPCDVRSPDCPSGTYCYFDPTAATPAAYCAPPADSKGEGVACISATACFLANPPKALNCTGLQVGQTGLCRAYCDTAAGSSGCIQVPKAQDCQQISGAPAGFGYCQPK